MLSSIHGRTGTTPGTASFLTSTSSNGDFQPSTKSYPNTPPAQITITNKRTSAMSVLFSTHGETATLLFPPHRHHQRQHKGEAPSKSVFSFSCSHRLPNHFPP